MANVLLALSAAMFYFAVEKGKDEWHAMIDPDNTDKMVVREPTGVFFQFFSIAILVLLFLSLSSLAQFTERYADTLALSLSLSLVPIPRRRSQAQFNSTQRAWCLPSQWWCLHSMSLHTFQSNTTIESASIGSTTAE
jgi:hypothetical protein